MGASIGKRKGQSMGQRKGANFGLKWARLFENTSNAKRKVMQSMSQRKWANYGLKWAWVLGNVKRKVGNLASFDFDFFFWSSSPSPFLFYFYLFFQILEKSPHHMSYTTPRTHTAPHIKKSSWTGRKPSKITKNRLWNVLNHLDQIQKKIGIKIFPI
jgi:hypothetical protein